MGETAMGVPPGSEDHSLSGLRARESVLGAQWDEPGSGGCPPWAGGHASCRDAHRMEQEVRPPTKGSPPPPKPN